MYLTISWTAPRHHQNGSVMVIIVYRTLRYTFLWNMNNIISRVYMWKYLLQYVGYFVYGSMCWLIDTQWRLYASVHQVIIGSDNDLSPVRRHYLNQCWHIIHQTPRNAFQWNFICNSTVSIKENAFEYVVCKMAAILSRLRVKSTGE